MIELSKKMGRLAMREEGIWWNAYYALPSSMDGAIHLGALHMKFVENQERKKAFVDLMRECVADIIEAECGIRPIWGGLEPAPENERAGKA
jgi:hypothetical protein